MRVRPLGQTGLTVSALGLGTVKLGRNKGVKYPDRFELPDRKAAANLLAVARDLGVNLLDTAPAYGLSEERLGELLHGQRRDWLICTKVGEEFDSVSGKSRFEFSSRHARASVERSLRRLRTDFLDLVLVHSDGNDLAIIEETDLFPALARMKEEGNIRAYGMSGKTVEGGLAALEASDCVMVSWHVGDETQRPVLDRAALLGKGVLIKKPLASGHLAAKAGEDDSVERSFAFVFSHDAVDCAIVGTLNPEHLQRNAAACILALQA